VSTSGDDREKDACPNCGPGVVCDRCNNGTLSKVDSELSELFAVKMRRTQLGVPSKKGTVPITRFQGGSLEARDGELFFEHTSPSQFRIVSQGGRTRILRSRHGADDR